jgi:hypothetical protein
LDLIDFQYKPSLESLVGYKQLCHSDISVNIKYFCKNNMAEADLLGGGLDIDGWSYLKNEVAGKIAEMTDRSLLLRSTFPLVLK